MVRGKCPLAAIPQNLMHQKNMYEVATESITVLWSKVVAVEHQK